MEEATCQDRPLDGVSFGTIGQFSLWLLEWRTVTGARGRKYYLFTERGHKVLDKSMTEWITSTRKPMKLIGEQADGELQSIPG